MKSKLTESQHIDICKPINLLNKKWGDKNPPQATQLWLKPHKKKQSSRESWKAKILSDTCKTMKKKKKKIVNTKRDANETVALVWTVTLNVWDKLERWQSIGKFGLKCQIAVLNDRTRKSCALGGQFTYAKKTVKRDKKHRRKVRERISWCNMGRVIGRRMSDGCWRLKAVNSLSIRKDLVGSLKPLSLCA